MRIGGAIVRWIVCWTGDRRVTSSNTRVSTFVPPNSPGQIVHNYVLLLPSSLIWYQQKLGAEQTDALTPYLQSSDVNRCLAEGCENED